MPEFDPFAKARVERPVFKKTFTDKDTGAELTLHLRAQDTLDAHLANDIFLDLESQYLTGVGQEGDEPMPFPPVGGQPVTLSKALLQSAANIVVMQSPPDGKGKKTAEFFIATAASSDVLWKEITAFAREVDRGDAKND